MFLFKRSSKPDFASTFAQIEREIDEISEKQSRMSQLRDRMLGWSWYLVYIDIVYAIAMYLFLLTPLPLLGIAALAFFFRRLVFAASSYYLSSGGKQILYCWISEFKLLPDRQLSALKAKQQDTVFQFSLLLSLSNSEWLPSYKKWRPWQSLMNWKHCMTSTLLLSKRAPKM